MKDALLMKLLDGCVAEKPCELRGGSRLHRLRNYPQFVAHTVEETFMHVAKNALTVAMATLATACTSSETMQSKMSQVGIGANRAAAHAVMGPPSATDVTNLLGAETSTDVWRSGITTRCEITYLFDHVVKKSCRSLLL